jgi:RNA polymerase sigma-70 factor (ECF subfamily)
VAPLLPAFLAALHADARAAFGDDPATAACLDRHRDAAHAAYPEITVDDPTFAHELARRLGAAATPEQLERTHADHVYLAIACAAGDDAAIRRFEADFMGEVDACAHRLRATADQAAEVGGHLRRILFVSEPGRPAATREFSGKGDLRGYLRVMATRDLIRLINKGRKEVGVADEALLDALSPAADAELAFLRDHYRADVDAAMRAALAGLSDDARALLRYHLIDGWSVDRIGALYGVHRSTAARRVTAAREELGAAIRTAVADRLDISLEEVDSIVRLVQSRVDVSIERLLG